MGGAEDLGPEPEPEPEPELAEEAEPDMLGALLAVKLRRAGEDEE